MNVRLKYNPHSIKMLRLIKGLTPVEFAKTIGGGVQRQNVYAWEKGVKPGINFILLIANAFGLKTLDYFFVQEDYSDDNNIVNEAHTERIAAG